MNSIQFQEEMLQYKKQLDLFPTPYCVYDYMALRKGIRFFTEHVFSIPSPISTKYFKEYYLLYWNGEGFILNTRNQEGYIKRNGTTFKIIYHRGCTRGTILKNPDLKVALSFRNPLPEFNLNAAVLVSFSESKVIQNV